MTVDDILTHLKDNPADCEELLARWSAGMQDEWDCSLFEVLEYGFGGVELAIAARSGSLIKGE